MQMRHVQYPVEYLRKSRVSLLVMTRWPANVAWLGVARWLDKHNNAPAGVVNFGVVTLENVHVCSEDERVFAISEGVEYVMATTIHTKIIDVSPSLGLGFTRDLDRLARLNPLVVAVEKVDGENVWKVTDRILLMGFIPYHVVYKISAVFVENGADVTVSAPMGIRSFSKWRVTDNGEKSCVVTEEAFIEAHPVLLPFIKMTLKQSHEEMLERMERELVGMSYLCLCV